MCLSMNKSRTQPITTIVIWFIRRKEPTWLHICDHIRIPVKSKQVRNPFWGPNVPIIILLALVFPFLCYVFVQLHKHYKIILDIHRKSHQHSQLHSGTTLGTQCYRCTLLPVQVFSRQLILEITICLYIIVVFVFSSPRSIYLQYA